MPIEQLTTDSPSRERSEALERNGWFVIDRAKPTRETR